MIDSHCHLDHEPLRSDLINVLKRSKEFNIDLIPDWYKALSKDKDELE